MQKMRNIKRGLYNKDNDIGEEKDSTYNSGRIMAPVWDGEHWELGGI